MGAPSSIEVGPTLTYCMSTAISKNKSDNNALLLYPHLPEV